MEENRMTFGAYLKAYFKQCLEVLKHPKMLLPTAILVVVWVWLPWVRLWQPLKSMSTINKT